MQGRFKVNTSVLFPKVGCRSCNCPNKIAEKYSRQLCQQHKQYSLWLKERAMKPRPLPSHIQVSKQLQENKTTKSKPRCFLKFPILWKAMINLFNWNEFILKPWTPAAWTRPPNGYEHRGTFCFFPLLISLYYLLGGGEYFRVTILLAYSAEQGAKEQRPCRSPRASTGGALARSLRQPSADHALCSPSRPPWVSGRGERPPTSDSTL